MRFRVPIGTPMYARFVNIDGILSLSVTAPLRSTKEVTYEEYELVDRVVIQGVIWMRFRLPKAPLYHYTHVDFPASKVIVEA